MSNITINISIIVLQICSLLDQLTHQIIIRWLHRCQTLTIIDPSKLTLKCLLGSSKILGWIQHIKHRL